MCFALVRKGDSLGKSVLKVGNMMLNMSLLDLPTKRLNALNVVNQLLLIKTKYNETKRNPFGA
jgi:hypothetical protein